ncbi:hypothetical protein [Allosalinactinospora lopnorensis]|uniref:hypothetical protein n=1 Tax=Allosalinactinospora lopnorensis TaxID=1352348 RepID=UPI00069616E4|nr:hypothetical protein [Allosalinactinospora lopnorensis]
MQQEGGTVAYTIAGEDHIDALGPEQCDLDFWMGQMIKQAPEWEAPLGVPAYLLEDAPLRQALLAEFSFQAIAEDKATRALSALLPIAPDTDCLEFYTSQIMDEARHRKLYRSHLLDLGVPPAELDQVIAQYAGDAAEAVLSPVEHYGLEDMAEHGDFYRGVLLVCVLVEGVIAPITELSERKWRLLDPVAARMQLMANRDETRHLAVGSTIIRRHLSAQPDRRASLLDMVQTGRELWQSLPMSDLQFTLEQVFQQGMEQHADVVGDYEIWPGRRMLDTTPEERAEVGRLWAQQIQDERLEYMLLA